MRFLLVGLANTAVGYGAILAFQFGLGMSPLASNAAGYVVGLALSYLLNRRFTFRSRRAHRTGLPAYVGVALLCYGINALVLSAALSVESIAPAAAQALAVVAYSLSFYALSRFLVFGRDTS